jgi:hypothetical protein
MEEAPRYRILSAATRRELAREVRRLEKRGWLPLDDPAMAVATPAGAAPYWVQTLYADNPPTAIVSKPPRPPRARSRLGVTSDAQRPLE